MYPLTWLNWTSYDRKTTEEFPLYPGHRGSGVPDGLVRSCRADDPRVARPQGKRPASGALMSALVSCDDAPIISDSLEVKAVVAVGPP